MANDEHGSAIRGLARKFREHLEAKDVDSFLDLFHDDCTSWRNFDGRTLVKRQLRKVIGFLSVVDNLRYADVRIHVLPSGWLQQHRLTGAAPSGALLDVSVCLVVQVVDGKIQHLDEYLDSKALEPLL